MTFVVMDDPALSLNPNYPNYLPNTDPETRFQH